MDSLQASREWDYKLKKAFEILCDDYGEYFITQALYDAGFTPRDMDEEFGIDQDELFTLYPEYETMVRLENEENERVIRDEYFMAQAEDDLY